MKTNHISKINMLLIACSLVLTATAEEPRVLVLEAEANVPNKDAIVRAEDGTSGGSYVSHPREWNPLTTWKNALKDGSYIIWARVRGTNVCLKSFDETGQQTELKWIFGVTENWQWVNFGTFPVEKLQSGFIIIRANKATDDAGLDVVVMDPTGSFDPKTPGIAEIPK